MHARFDLNRIYIDSFRLNERILNGKSSQFIDTSSVYTEALNTVAAEDLAGKLGELPVRDVTAMVDNSCHYINTKVGFR